MIQRTPTATNTVPRIVGTVTTDDGKLRILSPYNAAALSFLQSLPYSKFVKPYRVCMATPLAAAMLAEAGLSLDEPAKQLANLWWEGQLPAKIGQIAELLFTFKTKPWQHQQRAMSYAVNKPATLLNLGMGAGKTLTTICLLQAWKSNLNLVLCPKSVMGVWRREFHKHCNVSHNVTVLDKGTSKAKAEELKEAKRIAGRYAINAVVINYESSWREHIGEALLGMAWDCVVADESHRIKEMSSNQSKFAGSLAEVSSRRLALTGTVMPRGAPIEVLGQYRFLEPAIFGTTKTRFQDKYCIMDSKVPGRVLSYINQDDFMERFGKIAYRVQSKDVLTLPAIQQITIPVELEPKTRRYYETMKKECILELERGEVTAKNAAVKVMRLHQIACGHSKLEDGTIVHLGTEKRDVLMDMIEDISADEPIVVFCKFLEDLKSIEYVSNKLKRRYGEISGARKDLTSHSTMPDNIDIMGVQVKAGGTGLDLTRARYMFWLSACDTWGDFDQAIARVHRPGQEKPVFVYHLAATNTVDIKIYRSLRNQEDVGMRLLECLDRKDEDE